MEQKLKANQINEHKISELWDKIEVELYGKTDDKFLSTFRESHNPANRFSTWPPKEPTFRYYLNFLFNEVRKKDDNFFMNYKKLGETQLGNPLCVSAKGVEVNLDYLTCIEEYNFLSKNLNLLNIESVVEIGGGFGRTAHTLLKLFPNIKKYTIIDLPLMLDLSSKYLKKVLPNDSDKLSFIAENEIEKWENIKADLAINIDSFQEMPKQTIKNYIDKLFSKTNTVYIKNPVCKYSPELLGIEGTKKYDVFSIGYMTEIANIFDEVDLHKLRQIYSEKYCPSINHKIINQLPSDLFAYYQHILYKKY